MLITIIISLFLLILLPLFVIIALWRGRFQNRLLWLLDTIATALIIVWLYQIGNWVWVTSYLRYIWIILFLYASIRSYLKVKHLPWLTKMTFSQVMPILVYLVLIVLFGSYNYQTIQSYAVKASPIDLALPLKDGKYIVGQGGNATMMNYHHAYKDQKYALDILGWHPFGTRAQGIYPKALDKYQIYGDAIYSPCHGEVLEATDELNNLKPPEMDSEHPEGNHIKLVCEAYPDVDILLAHMKQDSITVKAGDQIEKGDMLGQVGNSGNTSEPHLHIHAEKDGMGVPITFHHKFFVRNQLLK